MFGDDDRRHATCLVVCVLMTYSEDNMGNIVNWCTPLTYIYIGDGKRLSNKDKRKGETGTCEACEPSMATSERFDLFLLCNNSVNGTQPYCKTWVNPMP
jgi:hypothetical protein